MGTSRVLKFLWMQYFFPVVAGAFAKYGRLLLTAVYNKGNWEWKKILHDIETERKVKTRTDSKTPQQKHEQQKHCSIRSSEDAALENGLSNMTLG